MTEQLYALKVTATAEVRDKDGNLISAAPIESVQTVTADQARELGLTIPDTQETS